MEGQGSELGGLMTSGVNGSYTIEESNVSNVNINFNTTKMVSYSSGTTAVGGIVAGACFNQYKIKNCNVTDLTITSNATSTGGISELANFLMGASYVLAAGFIYKYKKTKKMAKWACVISSVVMGIAAAIANYFILLPLFETFMPLDQLIASFGEFLPFIKTKLDVVLFNALPFNILKGLVIGAIAMMIYKKLTPILKGETLK